MADYLLLKWGTLKGYEAETEKFQVALQTLYDAEPRSMSAAIQRDTPEQKRLLCDVIDACEGEIQNDWSGETMTKEDAKKYVMEYRS